MLSLEKQEKKIHTSWCKVQLLAKAGLKTVAVAMINNGLPLGTQTPDCVSNIV